MHWLEETLRKSPWNGPTSKSGPGVRVKLPDRREAAFRSIGHFPQVRAGVPLTRSAESSLPDRMAPQVGFGPEYSIDNIVSYWFYCNASNVFVHKWPLCTTGLSHVTVFQGLLNLVCAFAIPPVIPGDYRIPSSTPPTR